MLITQCFKLCNNVKESHVNANKHGILVDDDENYDEKEDEKKGNECNLKQMKCVVDQDKKKINKRMNKKKVKMKN